MDRAKETASDVTFGLSMFCLRPHMKNISRLEDEGQALKEEGFGSVPHALLDPTGYLQVNVSWDVDDWRDLVHSIWPRVLFCEFLRVNRGGRLRKVCPTTLESHDVVYVLPMFVKGLPHLPDHAYWTDDALIEDDFHLQWDEEVQLVFYGNTFPTVLKCFKRNRLMKSLVDFILTLDGSRKQFRLYKRDQPFYTHLTRTDVLIGQPCPFSCSVHVEWGQGNEDHGILTTHWFMSRCDMIGEHHFEGCPAGTQEERDLVYSWVRRYVRECEMGSQPVTVADLVKAVTGSPRPPSDCEENEDWFEVTTIMKHSAPQTVASGTRFIPEKSIMKVELPCPTYTHFSTTTTAAVVQSKLVSTTQSP